MAKRGMLTLSTEDVPSGERLAYWEACVARVYLPMSIRPQGDAPFRAELTAGSLDDIKLAQISTTAQSGRRTVLGERCLLLINLDGTIHLRHGDSDVTLERHDMALVDARLPSAYSIPGNALTLALSLPREALADRLPTGARFAAAKLPAGLPMQQMTIGFFTNLYENFGAAAADLSQPTALRIAGHAVDLLGIALGDVMAQEPATTPYRAALLRRIKDFVEEHLHEPMLGVQVAAAKYRISARYVAMLFREDGTTFGEFLRQRRLERARRQLEALDATARQIGEIALAAGFASQAHFSRLFRAAYRKSPRQYRSAFERAGTELNGVPRRGGDPL
ncbi:helix-turn-helix domain-containing protein [Dongia sp.]|uniref:AraC-like ligand-binding domain-containing protein n=1 Tax=Dongia sp. TaxID=1977262 RepID=UPI0035B1D2BE